MRISEAKCDNCGKSSRDPEPRQCGYHPRRWYHLQYDGLPPELLVHEDGRHEWDFCSLKCLREWVTKQIEKQPCDG